MTVQLPQRPSDEVFAVVLPWFAQNMLNEATARYGQGTRNITAAGLRALWSLQKAVPWVHPVYGENPVGISVVSHNSEPIPRGAAAWPEQPAPDDATLKAWNDWFIPAFRHFSWERNLCRVIDDLLRVVYRNNSVEPVDADGYDICGMKDGVLGDFTTLPWERVRNYYASR